MDEGNSAGITAYITGKTAIRSTSRRNKITRLTCKELYELVVVDIVWKIANKQLLIVGHDADVGARPTFHTTAITRRPLAIGCRRRGTG